MRIDGTTYRTLWIEPTDGWSVLIMDHTRLPWRLGWAKALYVQLAGMALVFAVIGIDQYLTRNIYWNPKVAVDNAYAPVSWFYRVNSVFYDPSIYGRFLVIAIVAYRHLETGFVPEMDEGAFILDYWTPPGTSLNADEIRRKTRI